MRYVGLDVGRDFAHAAVVDDRGVARKLGRFHMGEEFAAFAATLGPDDAVALEASGNTWALAELLGRHAGKVVVSNPLRTRAIADAERKTDDIDAATLAELLAAEYLPEVWVPARRPAACAAWWPTGRVSSANGLRPATASPPS